MSQEDVDKNLPSDCVGKFRPLQHALVAGTTNDMMIPKMWAVDWLKWRGTNLHIICKQYFLFCVQLVLYLYNIVVHSGAWQTLYIYTLSCKSYHYTPHCKVQRQRDRRTVHYSSGSVLFLLSISPVDLFLFLPPALQECAIVAHLTLCKANE